MLFGSKNKLTRDIGIDLGTSTVLVYVDGEGIALTEPSIVAVNTSSDTICEIGQRAQTMLGRNPAHIQVLRPLKEGVIHHYDITQKMIQHYIRKVSGNAVFRPRVIICIPTNISEVEERAVLDAGSAAGARKTYLIDETIAAALGAGIDVFKPVGNMIVDIGGGTTDVAVISLGGVVVSQSIKIAGDKFDEAIVRYVRRKYNVEIGDRTAEAVKKDIGEVYEHKTARTAEVKGRCLVQGRPKNITLSSKEMLEAMMDPISSILDAICLTIEKTPPELVGDILKNGITLVGGGSLLKGLDRLITDVTGIRTKLAKDPIECVALGTGKALRVLDGMPEGKIDLSRYRQRI